MNKEKSLIKSMFALAIVGILALSIMPLTADAVVKVCDNTEGGVPGNRMVDDAQSPTAGEYAQDVVSAADGTRIDDAFGTTYQMGYMSLNADDFVGETYDNGEPQVIQDAPWGCLFSNMIWMTTFAKQGPDFTVCIDKWNTSTNGGYFTSGSDPYDDSGAFYWNPTALTLQKIPDVSISPASGATTTVSWNGLDDGNVLGFLVYRAATADNTNDGWGAGYSAWQTLAANPTVAVNTSAGSFTYSYDGTGSVYIPNGGTGQVHSFEDTTVSANAYYAVTCVVAGSNGGSPWNVESLYRGRASSMFTKASTPIDPVEFRTSTGIQLLQMPQDLKGLTTADLLADSIEASTSLEVLYISDYDNGWNDYLRRDASGTALPAFQALTDFTLDTDESYVIAIRYVAGDVIWNHPSWGYGSAANSVDLDPGWNNVGLFYDSSNYGQPTDIETNVAIIDSAAAWVANAWAPAGTGWTVAGAIEQQRAAGVTQDFDEDANLHGFFVRSPSGGTWDQSS